MVAGFTTAGITANLVYGYGQKKQEKSQKSEEEISETPKEFGAQNF